MVAADRERSELSVKEILTRVGARYPPDQIERARTRATEFLRAAAPVIGRWRLTQLEFTEIPPWQPEPPPWERRGEPNAVLALAWIASNYGDGAAILAH
jgi:hypothetical protein